jgi:opacity protein-like surface antigen
MNRMTVLSTTAMIMASSSSSFSGTMGSIIVPKNLTWVGTLSAGSLWERASQTQTVYLTPDIVKAYVARKTTHSVAEGDIFLGIQKQLPKRFQGQLGMAVAVTNNAALSGNVWDDAEALFNNYTYRYDVQHTHVLIKGKLLADRSYWLIPWVSAGIGVGFNNAHHFQNTPLISEATTMPNFSSNTQTSFTYTLGAGVQKVLTSHWQVGVGYDFSDWGRSQLGRSSGQTLNSGLRLNHLYTNGVLLNVTYLA